MVQFEQAGARARHGVSLTPLTIYRYSHGYEPARFELSQDFILYHSLLRVEQREVLATINGDGESIEVACTENVGARQRILIERGALQSYISAHQSVLVRYQDYRRALAVEPFVQAPSVMHQDGESVFRYIEVPPDGVVANTPIAYSQGKDLIEPGPANRGAGTHESPVVDVDAGGQQVAETCHGPTLSSYCRDAGREHYLTPDWFTADVLARYYENPRRYRVESGIMRCLDLWSIQFDSVSVKPSVSASIGPNTVSMVDIQASNAPSPAGARTVR